MDIEILIAKPEDAEDWARIRKECWLCTYPNEEYGITVQDILTKDFDSPEKIENWKKSFTDPKDGTYYFSAKKDGKVVGLCIAYKQEDYFNDTNELGALYVDIKHHRQGIGKLLMEKALSVFDKSKKTNLKVVSYNYNAINFYKKFGFKITGPSDDPCGKLPNGKVIPEVEMVKDI